MNPFLHSGYPDAAALQLIPCRELPKAVAKKEGGRWCKEE
jgi:hypothetical protein